MDSMDDMTGVAPFFGFGLDAGTIVASTVERVYSPMITADGRKVSAHSVSIGENGIIMPIDIKTGVTTTSKINSINLLDWLDSLFKD